MSESRQSLIYNLTGQVVYFYPPEEELRTSGAVASAATCSVWRGEQPNGGDTVVPTPTVTLDSVSTTVDQASGISQTLRNRIYLASTAGMAVGIRYLVSNTLNQRVVVTVLAIASGDYVTIDRDLEIDLAVGSTLKGIRHYFTIDPTFIQEPSNINASGAILGLYYGISTGYTMGFAPPFRVRWSYTAGSAPTTETWTYFDVVRQIAKHSVTHEDVRAWWPDLNDSDWIQQKGRQFGPQLGAAAGLVYEDAKLAGYDEDQIREGPLLDGMVRRAFFVVLAEAGICPSGWASTQAFLTEKQRDYNTFRDAAFARMAIDTTGGGEITRDPPRPMRLGR